MPVIKRNWPLIVALGLLYAVVAVCLTMSFRQNGGHLVYAVDDPYIHMAVAKNFSNEGVWGISRYGFSSTSSSLLWVLLLSLEYSLFGVNESAPLVLNLIFATATVCLSYFIFKKYGLSPVFNFTALLFLIFLSPIPTLIFVGMEHVLHTFVTTLFFYLSVTILSGEYSKDKKGISFAEKFLLAVGPLVVMSRYEGIFLVFVVCLLFFLCRRRAYCLVLGIVSVLPAALYALLSVSKGWYFLPNPVLLKGNMADYSSLKSVRVFLAHGLENLRSMDDVLIPLLVVSLLLFLGCRNREKPGKDFRFMVLVFLPIALLHLLFAKVGNFFRYEAYLVSLAVIVTAVALREYFTGGIRLMAGKRMVVKSIAAALLVYLVCSPLVTRGWRSLRMTPLATTNIYEQQYQMGLFLNEYYNGDGAAVNDIGAVSFLADVKLFDMRGLGTLEVAQLIRERKYKVPILRRLQLEKDVAVVIIYDNWFRMPADYIKVGEWKLTRQRVSTGGNTVSFYAVNFRELGRLASNLRHFSSLLPETVLQRGMYMSPDEALLN